MKMNIGKTANKTKRKIVFNSSNIRVVETPRYNIGPYSLEVWERIPKFGWVYAGMVSLPFHYFPSNKHKFVVKP